LNFEQLRVQTDLIALNGNHKIYDTLTIIDYRTIDAIIMNMRQVQCVIERKLEAVKKKTEANNKNNQSIASL
jgi:hypothetical protein